MSARTTEAHEYHTGQLFKGIAVIPHVGAPPSKARYVVVVPHMSSRQDFGAHNNNLPNLIRALNERVFNVQSANGLVPTPQPHQGEWKKLGSISKRLAARVTKFGTVVPLTSKEFVEQSPSNKRNLYAAAAEEMRTRGWSKRDARIKAFVKFEKLNFTKKGDPAPRVIQPRTPVYNIALGRYTRKVEEELYKALALDWGDDEEELVVMKGITVEEVAFQMRRKWLKYDQPVAVGLDASRFDQHVSVDALRWEHSIYNSIFKCPELAALLKLQLRNDGYAYLDGHKLTYTTNGTRASGDMNTSLGNCLIMCSLVRQYVRELGIKCDLVNNGDDCVLFLDRRNIARLSGLSEWFLKYGFEMEVEAPVYEFEEVVFCQAQPVLVSAELDKWVMVRQPAAALAKDAMCLSANSELAFRQWSYELGTGGLALYGDMPIYKELYLAYRRNGVPSNVGRSLLVSDSGFMRATRLIVRGNESSPIKDETRVSFYKAFGITPSIQVEMEEELRAMGYDGLKTYPANLAVSCGLYTA